MLPWACCAALLTIMALVGRLEAVDGPLFTCTKIFCRLWPQLSMGWVETCGFLSSLLIPANLLIANCFKPYRNSSDNFTQPIF